jgi:hypothetical protein
VHAAAAPAVPAHKGLKKPLQPRLAVRQEVGFVGASTDALLALADLERRLGHAWLERVKSSKAESG